MSWLNHSRQLLGMRRPPSHDAADAALNRLVPLPGLTGQMFVAVGDVLGEGRVDLLNGATSGDHADVEFFDVGDLDWGSR
jgi:hypothetical protein